MKFAKNSKFFLPVVILLIAQVFGCSNHTLKMARAIDKCDTAKVANLLDSGYRPTGLELRKVAGLGLVEITRLLLTAGVSPNSYDRNGYSMSGHGHRTPLMCAAEAGALDVVQLLVESGAAVNSRTKVLLCEEANDGRYYKLSYEVGIGNSALSLAIERGHVDVVRYLVGHGADVDTTVVHQSAIMNGSWVGSSNQLVNTRWGGQFLTHTGGGWETNVKPLWCHATATIRELVSRSQYPEMRSVLASIKDD